MDPVSGELDDVRPTILASEIRPSDIVILVMGTTGSGMSNFINKLTGMAAERGTQALGSCTIDVRAYAYSRGTKRFIFVDTPGFNSSSQPQNVVLNKIAHWLETIYRTSVQLAGIIYTYRLTDTPIPDAQLTALQILTALCGDEAACQVYLVTTMWDEVNVDDAVAAENTIKTKWQLLLDAGSRYERFHNTMESAWNIVLGLGDSRKALLLQKELVNIGMELAQTTAGRQLLLGVSQDRPSFPHNPRPTIQMSEIKPTDIVILVLGTTGSGMSNFINKLTGMPAENETHTLGSCTTHVRAYACDNDGKRFIFIDTPGFNSPQSQNVVLTKIAHWLRTTYRSSIKLAGIIYTYRIIDTHASGEELVSLHLLAALCGDEMADRVRLVTTMWDESDVELGRDTENRIISGPWKLLLDAGSHHERFFNTQESAWDIVLRLGDGKKALLLQRELVDIGVELVQTTAARQLLRGTTQSSPSFAPYPRVAIQVSDIKHTDIVIMVLGTTGSGISNFIDKLTGMPAESEAGALGSCTVDVKAYAYSHNGKRFVFVDTPGLNNMHASKREVLSKIMEWLGAACRMSIQPTGVIYMRRITDEDKSGAEFKSFKTLSRWCGPEAADRVRLVTTMWDDVDMESDTKSMEAKLKNTNWEPLLSAGASYERFHNTRESAWEIVLGIGETKKSFLIQELLDLRKYLAIRTAEIMPSDNVIIVLGTTGSGMSNFINKLTGMRPEMKSQELASCTKDVTPYAYYLGDQRFVFVDTPGLDNTRSSQKMVLKKTEDWLAAIYRRSIKPTGVIYTYCISEAHESGTKSNNFRLFSDLCGREAADRVRVVTTMWDEADVAFAETVEHTMKAGPWKSLLDAGACCARFHNTTESAWEIVLGLGDTKKALLVQEDHAMRKKLDQTLTLRRVPSKSQLIGSSKRFAALRARFRR